MFVFCTFPKIQFNLYTIASREASPIRSSERPLRYRNELVHTNSHLHNGHLTTTEPSDDDEYIDTVEVIMIIICRKKQIRFSIFRDPEAKDFSRPSKFVQLNKYKVLNIAPFPSEFKQLFSVIELCHYSFMN